MLFLPAAGFLQEVQMDRRGTEGFFLPAADVLQEVQMDRRLQKGFLERRIDGVQKGVSWCFFC
jgi:hypothetical protein